MHASIPCIIIIILLVAGKVGLIDASNFSQQDGKGVVCQLTQVRRTGGGIHG
jgi:hypothetical protein